jgi:hypothetical protein
MPPRRDCSQKEQIACRTGSDYDEHAYRIRSSSAERELQQRAYQLQRPAQLDDLEPGRLRRIHRDEFANNPLVVAACAPKPNARTIVPLNPNQTLDGKLGLNREIATEAHPQRDVNIGRT